MFISEEMKLRTKQISKAVDPENLMYANEDQQAFADAFRGLENAMAQDIEAVYEESDPEQYLDTVEEEDLWAESILAIGVLALLFRKQSEKGLSTLANIYNVFPHKDLIDASQSGINAAVRKYERDLRNKLPSRHQLKTFNNKLKSLGKSVVERGKLLVASFAGVTKKQAKQIKDAVIKMVEGGKSQTAIVREAIRRRKTQLNKRINLAAKLTTKNAKETAKMTGVKALQKMNKLPDGELWCQWMSVNDSAQSKTCGMNSGKKRKVGEKFPDGSKHPPSNTPHPCRSQLRYYIKMPDGSEQDLKGTNKMKSTYL